MYYLKEKIGSSFPPGPQVRFSGWNTVYPYYKDYLGYLTRLYEDHGGMGYFRAGSEHIYLVNDLKLVEEILIKKPLMFVKGTGYERAKLILGEGLLTSGPDIHDPNRLLVQPAFHKQQVENMIRVMTSNIRSMLDQWEENITKDNTLEIHNEAVELLLKIICEAIFSEDSDKELIGLGSVFSSVFNNYGLFLLAFPGITSKLPLPAVKKFKATKQKFDDLIYKIIERRRSSPKKHFDILSMLIESSYEDGGKMTDQQIRDEIVTLIFAAHDTSAKTLTWALYLLAQNPEHIGSIIHEASFLSSVKDISFSDIKKLSYTRAVISESLRLYPPAHSISRKAAEDVDLGGYTIAKGSSILIMPYIIHRDRKYYKDPVKFDPSRWLGEEKGLRPKLSFIPFGAGSRGCLGEQFAWTQLILSAAFICLNYKFELQPGQNIVASSSITLKPKNGIKMKIMKR